MGSVPQPSKLEFVPWDFNSEEHTERVYLQRVACGWKWEEVPQWVEKCKEGKMMLYWLALMDSVPNRETQIASHVKKYPEESSPISDTATLSWLSRPRTPTHRSFVPIGHVALLVPPPIDPTFLSFLPAADEVVAAYIGKLYVSYALHSNGYGGAAVRAVEAIARDQLGAALCVLDTMDPEYQMRKDVIDGFYVKHGNPAPKISNQQWYENMGYEFYQRDEKGYEHWEEGQKEYCPVHYFRKTLK